MAEKNQFAELLKKPEPLAASRVGGGGRGRHIGGCFDLVVARQIKALAVLIALLMGLLTGCSVLQPPGYGFVQREWSKSLRQLGIVPVFPPREDVFVGDVYAYSYDPSDIGLWKLFDSDWEDLDPKEQKQRLAFGMNSRLARLDIGESVSKEYLRTPAAPQTTDDYNDILGNPVLAAANESLERAKEKVASLKAEIAAAETALAQAERGLTVAKRDKEDTALALVEAQTALDNASARPIGTSELDEQLAGAKLKQRAKEDAVADARYEHEDAPDGSPKEEAQRRLTTAEREKTRVDTQIARLEADIAAKRAQPQDVLTERQALEEARRADREAATQVTSATRNRDDQRAALTKIQTDNTANLAAAEAKVEQQKTLRDAIAQAGIRTLYAQPQYNQTNVFTGEEFPDPKGGTERKKPRVNRFRLVGFPEFATASITQGDLSAFVPVDMFGLGLNISKSNIDQVVIKVPAAESYGISFGELFNDNTIVRPKNCGPGWILGTKLCKYSNAAQFQTGYKPGTNKPIYFRVLSEVFYARAVDVSIFSSSSFGMFLEAGLVETETRPEDPMTGIDRQGPMQSRVAGDADTNAILAQIQANLGRTQQVPGGSVQLVSVNSQSVGLRMVYDRPVAIGFRGVVIEFYPETGSIGGEPDIGTLPSFQECDQEMFCGRKKKKTQKR